jgi:hypothetical protein
MRVRRKVVGAETARANAGRKRRGRRSVRCVGLARKGQEVKSKIDRDWRGWRRNIRIRPTKRP